VVGNVARFGRLDGAGRTADRKRRKRIWGK
jgi:hypothetical protein